MSASGIGHHLAEHVRRRVGEPDVVAVALAHLLHAVGALEQRQRQAHLRRHAELLHQLAAGQQVEQLVGPAQLDIGLDGYGVVRLRHRIEELVQRDRLLLLVAVRKSSRSRIRATVNWLVSRSRSAKPSGVEPLRVAPQLGRVRVEDAERLVDVGLRVLVDLLARERRARRVAARGVADERREVADDEHDGVPEVLELAQLAQRHGVAEVQVGGGRVDAELHAERPPARELA